MKYIIRKYTRDDNQKGIFKVCIGVLGEYDNREDAESAFWKFQISAFREQKDFFRSSDWAFDRDFKFERENLVNYINERFPFYNEYYYPDSAFTLDNFTIPDEVTDDDIKALSQMTKVFFFEIFEFKEEVVFYVPVTEKTVKDYQGKLKKIDFSYFCFSEDNYGTRAYVYELFAKLETEEYLSHSHFKIEPDEISSSYRLLKMSYQEYINFRYNELSKVIEDSYAYYKCIGVAENLLEFISNMFQLPLQFLKTKLEPETIECLV